MESKFSCIVDVASLSSLEILVSQEIFQSLLNDGKLGMSQVGRPVGGRKCWHERLAVWPILRPAPRAEGNACELPAAPFARMMRSSALAVLRSPGLPNIDRARFHSISHVGEGEAIRSASFSSESMAPLPRCGGFFPASHGHSSFKDPMSRSRHGNACHPWAGFPRTRRIDRKAFDNLSRSLYAAPNNCHHGSGR